ncbi:unnamed protein product [Peniophora sp. CBMAI 1063]|nr:unnamed protein product [Peniophora sp. CBMAI 1063]
MPPFETEERFEDLPDIFPATMANSMLDYITGDGVDINMYGSEGVYLGPGQAPEEYTQDGSERPRQTASMPSDPHFHPYPDRVAAVLDVLRHLPRSIFSDSQMETITWACTVLGLDDIPSVTWLKDLSDQLQKKHGIRTLRYKGALGNVYYCNSLMDQIAQEFTNPRVAPHLHAFPEFSQHILAQAWQGSRWLHEADPALLTPMLRLGSKGSADRDLYIFEPAQLTSQAVVMPHRFYTRKVDVHDQYFAAVWSLEAAVSPTGALGWVVREFDSWEVPVNQFSLCFTQLCSTARTDGLPDPRIILGVRKAPSDARIHPWTRTANAGATGNDWRQKAMGHRVVSFWMWLYCNDTSGNLSKKWNKHNSFLWTPAGLSHEMSQQQYNVHFLSTSNIAPPLEMLDGIATQLEEGQRDGFWVWDIARDEPVLVIPAVLALLGDNPMQSELACHIGLMGKFFCRVCRVKGCDAADEAETRNVFPSPLNIDPLEPGAPMHRGPLEDQNNSSDHESASEQPTLPDLDVHKDTPVEVLHVVLLGFVKYFWRDIIARLKDEDKALLPTCLSSVDVSGLGISPLVGQTLTQYVGSLTGRDFRAIAQVAPFVLYDLAPTDCYDTWIALSRLVPLIWQPEIFNLNEHIAEMETVIDYFLKCTARWTPRWFNKPKFHLLRHLPFHVRRFGPAVLFATEAFESFNAVIRDHSIHSNRHAPSRDIALGLAHASRVRHIMSGGLFPTRDPKAPVLNVPPKRSDLNTAGGECISLVERRSKS